MNKELQGRYYTIPQDVLQHIQKYVSQQTMNADGMDRATNLLKTGKVNYGQLKRILHDMEYVDKQKEAIKYNLWGGQPMEQWGWQMLGGERYTVKNNKKITKNAKEIGGIDGIGSNPFLKKHEKNPYSKPLLEEINKIKKLM